MLLFPYLMAIFAMVAYSAMPPLAKKFQLDFPPFAFMASSSAILGFISVFCSFFLEKSFSIVKTTPTTWLHMFIFSVVNLIGFFLYLKAIEKIPAVHYQLMFVVSPVVVAIFAYFILGERVEIRQIIGLVIMSAGLCVAIWPKA